MHPNLKPVAILCYFAFATVIGLSRALGDVIITKSGKRYEGTVTKTETSYIVRRSDGKKFSLPKSVVVEHLESAVLQTQYDEARRKADLANEEHVQKLLDLANKGGLTESRQKLLADVFQLRWRQSEGDRRRLESLAAWCQKHELAANARRCAEAIARLEFERRRAAAADDAVEIAKLARWCEEHGLMNESRESASDALRISPNNLDVRKLLGYERNDEGDWVKKVSYWKVRVIRATLAPGYSENLGASTTRYSPKQEGHSVALVDVEFEALSPGPGSFDDRIKGARNILSEQAIELLVPTDVATKAKPFRLFLSTSVLLEPTGGSTVPPGFTSCPSGHGFTLAGSTMTIKIGASSGVLNYVRGENVTAILIAPGQKERLTMLYSVPKTKKTALLRFYDAEPIPVKLH